MGWEPLGPGGALLASQSVQVWYGLVWSAIVIFCTVLVWYVKVLCGMVLNVAVLYGMLLCCMVWEVFGPEGDLHRKKLLGLTRPLQELEIGSNTGQPFQ